jgi:hypothetical protein
MSLQDNERAWVDRLATQAKVSAALAKRREAKDAILERMAGQIELARAEILEKMKSLQASDGEQVMQVLDYLSRDQTTEFDLADQMSGYGFSEEAQKKLLEVGQAFDLLSRELNAKVKAIDPATGDELDSEEALFSTQDLKKDLYQPVVRQGLMSDTFVRDEHSDTAEMLKGSFGAYKDRLDEEGLKSAARENFDLALVLAKSTASMVSAGFGIKGADDEASKLEFKLDFFTEELHEGKPGAIAEMCGIGLEVVAQGIEAYDTRGEMVEGREQDLVEEQGPSNDEEPESVTKARARRVAMAPRVATQMRAAAAAALGNDWKGAGWDLGVAASGAFGSAVKAAALARPLATSVLARAQVEQARDALAAGFPAAMTSCDPGTPASPGVPASTALLQRAGQAMQQEFVARLDVDAVLQALQAEKFDEASRLVGVAATAAVSLGKAEPELDLLLGDADRQQRARDAAGQKLAEDFARELDDQEKADRRQLAELANAAEGQQQASLLAQRIKAMEQHERLVGWAASLAGLGLEVASKFIGPLAIAGTALSLAQDIAKACKRTRDWYNFYDSKVDLFQAASPFSAPVANFHVNARKQAIHYQINAALDFVNMIGAVAETAGLASMGIGVAAGKVIQGAASGAAALEAALYEIAKRYAVEKAWSTYRDALQNPENRRLGLIAMKENPTLAKYAVAWGAIVKQDALVADFLGHCDLTVEELQDPASRLGDVVKYLELRLPDDSQIVGREVVKGGWQPADNAIVLTAASWAGARKLAEANARLEVADTRDIELALLDFARLDAQLLQGGRPKPDHEQARAFLAEAIQALNAYRPRRQGPGVEHAEMKALAGKFREKAAKRLGELDELIKSL